MKPGSAQRDVWAEKNPQTDIDRAEAALKRALVRLSLVDEK